MSPFSLNIALNKRTQLPKESVVGFVHLFQLDDYVAFVFFIAHTYRSSPIYRSCCRIAQGKGRAHRQ